MHHLAHVKLVLDALNKHQIKKLEKCRVFTTEVEYLGHIVNGTEVTFGNNSPTLNKRAQKEVY